MGLKIQNIGYIFSSDTEPKTLLVKKIIMNKNSELKYGYLYIIKKSFWWYKWHSKEMSKIKIISLLFHAHV